MSDRKQELLRRLRANQRRLERAHAEYLKANSESQKALTRMLDSFSEMSDSIHDLIRSAPDEPSQVEMTPDSDESNSETLTPPTPTDIEPPQNTLVRRLNSPAMTLPVRKAAEVAEVTPKEEALRPPAPRYKGLRVELPSLVTCQPDAGPFPPLSKESRLVLTNDGFGVAPILNEILTARGFRVRVESRRPELTAPADILVFLGSLRAPAHLDDAMAVVEDAMHAAQKMTTRLMQPGSGFIAAIDTAGGFGLDDFDPVAAPFGAILGMIRLLDMRHPGAATKLIDLNGGHLQAAQIAELLAQELLNGGLESPIALGGAERRSVDWTEFDAPHRPAAWLEHEPGPLVYMPGPDAILSTAVERLAIAHELPLAVLRRDGTPGRMVRHFGERGIEARSTDYDFNRLFAVMDFFDRLRADHGPIAAIIAESFPRPNRSEWVRWDQIRPALDEFNALLAMTINDPLHLLGVGLGPKTAPVVASALRYFARAESLRRNEHLQVRLLHIKQGLPRGRSSFDPTDFALTELLSMAAPPIAEVRIKPSPSR